MKHFPEPPDERINDFVSPEEEVIDPLLEQLLIAAGDTETLENGLSITVAIETIQATVTGLVRRAYADCPVCEKRDFDKLDARERAGANPDVPQYWRVQFIMEDETGAHVVRHLSADVDGCLGWTAEDDQAAHLTEDKANKLVAFVLSCLRIVRPVVVDLPAGSAHLHLTRPGQDTCTVPDRHPATAAAGDTVYLLERRNSKGAQLYIGVFTGFLQWTEDRDKALRLARREDADKLAEVVDDCERIGTHTF